MNDSDHDFSALHSLPKPEIIEILDHNKHRLSLFDQLIAQEYIPIEPDSFIDLLEHPLNANNLECKIEEESPQPNHVHELSRTQEEPPNHPRAVEGCRCSCNRSQCRKKYCPCFRESNGCGEGCRCRSCLNRCSFGKKNKRIAKLLPFWSREDLKWQ